jgi:L-seryl-tRNA(Ser) seleniumtransferase
MNKYGIDMIQLTEMIKQVLEELRQSILMEEWHGAEPGSTHFIEEIFKRSEKKMQTDYSYTLKRVINATGTILHTNLGRARLSEQAIQHVIETAKNYSNLEYLVEEGSRGSRHLHAEKLLKEITGAEAAMVVNNNAAAVFLTLTALAKQKEVIVSRGQLVEIGGSFRISSIMEESGAHLVDVGTTNKTHLYDYENAISEQTAMILKVHTSNFKVIGFTKSVNTEELGKLAAQHEQVIFYEDLGSGVLYDYRLHGIGDEPVVSEVLKQGADLVSFSGDKLLGGPQAGIIVGKRKLIDQLKKHQLARALRVDKMTLAALEGTLLDYIKGQTALQNIPIVRDLLTTKEELKERSERFLHEITAETTNFDVSIKESVSQVGGGTMPEVELPTYVIAVTHMSYSAVQLAKKLRTEFTPSIVVRIQKEEVYIDLRTVTGEEEQLLFTALTSIT